LSHLRLFNRQKPFYPLIVHYEMQLLGMRELALRGIFVPRNVESVLPLPGVGGNIQDVRAYAHWLNGPVGLKCEADGTLSRFDPDETAHEMWSNKSYLDSFNLRSAGALLLLAYEETKESPARDGGPLWEFFRHCRNAVGHNHRFHFRKKEPNRPAGWRRFSLTRDMHGTNLWGDANPKGLLGPADPLELLWDIEQTYPNL